MRAEGRIRVLPGFGRCEGGLVGVGGGMGALPGIQGDCRRKKDKNSSEPPA